MLSFAASICRRVNLKKLVASAPLYTQATGASGGGMNLASRRWATKKTAGSTKNGRDSEPKNLGVKKYGGELSAESDSRKHHRSSKRNRVPSRCLLEWERTTPC